MLRSTFNQTNRTLSVVISEDVNEFSLTDITSIVLLILIIIIGTVGNSIVIYVFGVKPGKSRKRFETFLLVLGIVDLLSSILVPLPLIYLTATNYQHWHFGEIGCKLIPSLLQISIFISQGVLILICYERYRTIVHPFKSRLTLKQALMWLVFTFVLSILFSIPYVKTFKVIRDDVYKIHTCVPAMGSNKTLLVSAVIYLVRDIVISFILVLLSHKMRLFLRAKPSFINWDRSRMFEKGRRLLVVVIVVFLVLTLPADMYRVIIYVMFHTNVDISTDTYKALLTFNTFLNILQISNSICNVFIYSRVHSNFWSLLKLILKRNRFPKIATVKTTLKRENEQKYFVSSSQSRNDTENDSDEIV